MKSNLGKIDRIIRVMLAVAITILYFAGQFQGAYGAIAMVLAVVFAATAFISFCPLYYMIGMSTKKSSQTKASQ